MGILKNLRYSSTSSSVVLALQGSAYEQSSELDIPVSRHDPARDQLFKFFAWKELKHVPGTQYILNKTQTPFSLRYESYHDTKASVFLFPLFQSTNLSRFSTPPPKHNFYLMNIYENFLWKGDMNAEGMKK